MGRRTQATVAEQAQVVNAEVAEVANAEMVDIIDAEVADAESEGLSFDFASLIGADAVEEDSREAILKKLLAKPTAKALKGVTVRNVVYNASHPYLLTFVIKEWVVGDVRDTTKLDAFNMPTIALGRTHNVQASTYGVAGVMKDSPKLAIFAKALVDDGTIANDLFAGAKIDVVMEYVPKNTPYVNPFASNSEPVQFDRDKMIHYITRLELGEVGMDMYKEHIRR